MKTIFITLCLCLTFITQAQIQNDSVIISINGNPVLLKEFLTIKNKNQSVIVKDTLSTKAYLDLFVNYKLKLVEAKAKGIDQSEEFLKEFEKYTKHIADEYIFSNSVEEQILKDAYERMQWDVKTGHILISVPQKATPQDSSMAYDKAIAARNRLLKGEDFVTVARSTSNDPGVEKNNGIIGYITSLQTPPYYENAAYSLKPGEVSMPIKSREGFYIIKLFDKRKSHGEVKVKQVMCLFNQDKSNYASLKETLDSVYLLAIKDSNFSEISKSYSDEPSTKENGGDVPWFNNSARYPQEFKEIAFALNVGEISKPFETTWGWHILKLEEKRPLPSYDAMKTTITKTLEQGNRNKDLTNAKVIGNLKKKFAYKADYEAIKLFSTKIDTVSGNYSIKDTLNLNKVLATAGKEKISEKEFAYWLIDSKKTYRKNFDLAVHIIMLFDDFIEAKLISMERRDLLINNIYYKEEVQDYLDGMLVFDITSSEVWSKASDDTIALLDYYNKNKNKYYWDERVNVNIFICKDTLVAQKIKKELVKKQKKSISAEDFVAKVNSKDSTTVKLINKIYAKGENKIIDSFEWKENSINWENPLTAVEIVSLLPPTPKEFSQCKGTVIADYQKQLENEWINTLKAKYLIEINTKLLETIDAKN
ncbi:MAG: peptidylprolyl isomerase [Bacteroidales bacterium]|nr:peptidylprolyl isomerase [Bacteroidales bacterium]